MTDLSHFLAYLKQGIHFDGRKLDEYRPIEVEGGISKTAEGSARVKIGNTEVLAGVKMLIEKPYPDTPDQGSIMVNAELLALSNPEFEPGPPGIEAIELARIVDRCIRESKIIDLKKLCIKKGEKCWIVSVDICTINDEGNLHDASTLATLIALKNAKFPQYENDEVDYSVKTTKSLPLAKITPLTITVIKLGEYYFVDPLLPEEKVLGARLTCGVILENHKLCSLQKGGDDTLTIHDIDAMAELAVRKARELAKFVK